MSKILNKAHVITSGIKLLNKYKYIYLNSMSKTKITVTPLLIGVKLIFMIAIFFEVILTKILQFQKFKESF